MLENDVDATSSVSHCHLTFQGLAWMQAHPSSTHYFGSTRTQLREIIYEMTGFMLPRGKKVLIPMETPTDEDGNTAILRWLYENATSALLGHQPFRRS